jgi:hypothetical protein
VSLEHYIDRYMDRYRTQEGYLRYAPLQTFPRLGQDMRHWCTRSSDIAAEDRRFTDHLIVPTESGLTLFLLETVHNKQHLPKMNGLSDLELVAQAMAPTNLPRPANQTPPSQLQTQSEAPAQLQTRQPTNTTTTDPPATQPNLNAILPDLSELGIDLSSLSPAELTALQPIIDALTNSSLNDTAGEGDDEDDLKIAELLQQMEAAGLVADDLEGKLDALLENLGETEREIEAGLPGRQIGTGAGDIETGGDDVEKVEPARLRKEGGEGKNGEDK